MHVSCSRGDQREVERLGLSPPPSTPSIPCTYPCPFLTRLGHSPCLPCPCSCHSFAHLGHSPLLSCPCSALFHAPWSLPLMSDPCPCPFFTPLGHFPYSRLALLASVSFASIFIYAMSFPSLLFHFPSLYLLSKCSFLIFSSLVSFVIPLLSSFFSHLLVSLLAFCLSSFLVLIGFVVFFIRNSHQCSPYYSPYSLSSVLLPAIFRESKSISKHRRSRDTHTAPEVASHGSSAESARRDRRRQPARAPARGPSVSRSSARTHNLRLFGVIRLAGVEGGRHVIARNTPGNYNSVYMHILMHARKCM